MPNPSLVSLKKTHVLYITENAWYRFNAGPLCCRDVPALDRRLMSWFSHTHVRRGRLSSKSPCKCKQQLMFTIKVSSYHCLLCMTKQHTSNVWAMYHTLAQCNAKPSYSVHFRISFQRLDLVRSALQRQTAGIASLQVSSYCCLSSHC